jgi:outer membrane protein TolC
MNRISLLFALLASSLASMGQSAMTLSLEEAIHYALDHNAQIQIQDLEKKAAEKVLLQNIALGLPSVNMGSNYTDNIELPAQFFDINQDGVIDKLQFGTRYNSVANFSVNQLVFDGSYVVALLATQVLRDMADVSYEKATIDVREQVAQAYHLRVILSENATVLNATLGNTASTLKNMQIMQGEGFVAEEDVDQLAIVYHNLEANLANLESQIQIAELLLKLQCGISPEVTLQLSTSLESLLVHAEAGQSLLGQTFEVQNHLDFRQLRTNRKGQYLNLQNEKMQFLPKLYAGYAYNRQFVSESANVYDPNGVSANNTMFQSWNISAQVPLFQSGRKIARVQEQQIKLQELDLLLANTENALKLQNEQARAEYANALKVYQIQVQNVALAERVMQNTETKLVEGMASSMEYSQASSQYQQSVAAMLQAANTALNKRVALEKSLGAYNL